MGEPNRSRPFCGACSVGIFSLGAVSRNLAGPLSQAMWESGERTSFATPASRRRCPVLLGVQATLPGWLSERHPKVSGSDTGRAATSPCRGRLLFRSGVVEKRQHQNHRARTNADSRDRIIVTVHPRRRFLRLSADKQFGSQVVAERLLCDHTGFSNA